MQKYDTLYESFIFSGIDEKKVDEILQKKAPILHTFSRGETILSPKNEEKKIFFIIEGKCEARRRRADGSTVVLNTLSPGDSFGILSVFGKEKYPTEVCAMKSTSVFSLSDKDIFFFIENYAQIAKNIISFLADRVAFLNDKINTFSGITVEDRLASYLLCISKKLGTEIQLNCKKCAEEINAGRASVYRALASLESEGLIKFDDKKIILLDREGLERIKK